MKYGLIYSAINYESSVNVIHCATAKEDKQQLMSFATQFREILFLDLLLLMHYGVIVSTALRGIPGLCKGRL